MSILSKHPADIDSTASLVSLLHEAWPGTWWMAGFNQPGNVLAIHGWGATAEVSAFPSTTTTLDIAEDAVEAALGLIPLHYWPNPHSDLCFGDYSRIMSAAPRVADGYPL